MPHPLIVKLEQRDGLSPEERVVLELATTSVETFKTNEDIVREGDIADHSCLILEGWTIRAKSLADGRRQITAFHIPGDFVDLHSFLLKPMDHTITAIYIPGPSANFRASQSIAFIENIARVIGTPF